jgi:hypothetical protein
MNRRLKPRRRGISLTEVMVAATLVLSIIGLATPLTVRVGRVWQSTRQYRLALHELANQMELLTAHELVDCKAALSNLEPSAVALESLPGARLQGDIVCDQDGTRLVLQLDWDRGVESVPLSLVGWLDTESMTDVANSSPKGTPKIGLWP